MPADNFNASAEAVRIEHIAKEVLDTDIFKNDSCSADLAREWMTLTPAQRTEVGKELVKQFDNANLNSLPRPQLQFDAKGECTAIDFKASALDFKNVTDDVRVAAIHPTTGGELTQVSHTGPGSKTADWLDQTYFDAESTERNTTKESLLKAGGVAWDFNTPSSLVSGDLPPASMDSEPAKTTQKKPAMTGF